MNDEEIDPSVLLKYEILQKLGKGAYGVVWKAIDKKTREMVAVKKIFDAFQNATDAQRTFREVVILQELGVHENIVNLMNVLKSESNKDLYLVFDYMETDLHAVIRAKIMADIHKQYITYQLLKCLKYIHSSGVIHRDLKPSNILLNSECFVKLADFGLARSLNSLHADSTLVLTDYVATRWYRAPEILFGFKNYTTAADIWAVGCIVAEMYLGKPLFPGTSTLHQFEKIFEVTNMPTKAELAEIYPGINLSFLEPIRANMKLKQLNSIIGGASDEAKAFIMKLLELNPAKRFSAKEALEDPYLKVFHNELEEPENTKKVVVSLDDNKKYEASDYRDKLYSDIKKKKKAHF
jgi:mitogen-activated protein kinase 15